eukprot:6184978-Pleurochrysis_carterae.AAC.1
MARGLTLLPNLPPQKLAIRSALPYALALVCEHDAYLNRTARCLALAMVTCKTEDRAAWARAWTDFLPKGQFATVTPSQER